jgi:hypothetical protein
MKQDTLEVVDDYFTELFGPPSVATAPEPQARTACLVCEMGGILRAHAEYAICIHCAADATTAEARLDGRERHIHRLLGEANDIYHTASEALTAEQRKRWDAFCGDRLHVEREGRRADIKMRENIARMLEAYKRRDPRIAPALLDMYAAGERMYWANAEAAGLGARVERARDELHRCIQALATAA